MSAGTPITVIGVVRGATTRPLDESEYTYPVVEIKHLIDWNAVLSHGPVYAEWVAVEKDYLVPGLRTVYIDPATIRREGNLVTLWQLIDFKWMQGNVGMGIYPGPHRFFSTKTHKQFDCAGKLVRLLAFTDLNYGLGGLSPKPFDPQQYTHSPSSP